MKGAARVARRFGDNLRAARARAGISQEELGFRAGLHRTEIGLLERGARVPRIDTLIKLSNGLGVGIECPLLDGISWQPGDMPSTAGSFAFAPHAESDLKVGRDEASSADA